MKMKVSIEQAKLAAKQGRQTKRDLTTTTLYDKPLTTSADAEMLLKVQETIRQMPDVREDLVQEIKARIEAGTYNPSGDDIADAMIRRTLADQIR